MFRRKYYKNGSHAGFILYMTDAAQEPDDVDRLREALKSAKGPGNFRNLFMYAPNGKKDGIQLIPVSEVAAKDEFLNIKNVTRDDQLDAHRAAADGDHPVQHRRLRRRREGGTRLAANDHTTAGALEGNQRLAGHRGDPLQAL